MNSISHNKVIARFCFFANSNAEYDVWLDCKHLVTAGRNIAYSSILSVRCYLIVFCSASFELYLDLGLAFSSSVVNWRGQDSPWKSQSECQRTEINGESTSVVLPTLGSRTATEQNRTVNLLTVYAFVVCGCVVKWTGPSVELRTTSHRKYYRSAATRLLPISGPSAASC